MDFFKVPSLGTKAGKVAWCEVVPVYWDIAFAIASAVA